MTLGVGLRLLLHAVVTLQWVSGQAWPAWYLNTRVQTGAVRGASEADRGVGQGVSSLSSSALSPSGGWVKSNSPVHLPPGNTGQYNSVASNNVWSPIVNGPQSGPKPAPTPSDGSHSPQTANTDALLQRPGFEQTVRGSVPFLISVHFLADSPTASQRSGSGGPIAAASRPWGGLLGQSLTSSGAAASSGGMLPGMIAAGQGSGVYERKETASRVWTLSPRLRLSGGSEQSQPEALSLFGVAETSTRARRDRPRPAEEPLPRESLLSGPARLQGAAHPWAQRQASPTELSLLPGFVPSRTSDSADGPRSGSSEIPDAVQPYTPEPANAANSGLWFSGSSSNPLLTYRPVPFPNASSFDVFPSGLSRGFPTDRRPERASQHQPPSKISTFSIFGSYPGAHIQQNSPPYTAPKTSRESDLVSAHGQNRSQPVDQDNITSGVRFYWPAAAYTNNSQSSLNQPLRPQHLNSHQRQHIQLEEAALTFPPQPGGPQEQGFFRPPTSEHGLELAAPFPIPRRPLLFIFLAAPWPTDRKGPTKVTERPLSSKPNHSMTIEERFVADTTKANLSSESPLTGQAEPKPSATMTAQLSNNLQSEISTPNAPMEFKRLGSFVTDSDCRKNTNQAWSLDDGGSFEAERSNNGIGSYN